MKCSNLKSGFERELSNDKMANLGNEYLSRMRRAEKKFKQQRNGFEITVNPFGPT